MKGADSSGTTPQAAGITLTPLATQGRDALGTKNADAITDLRLVKVQFADSLLFHQITTKEADDLFALSENATAAEKLIPPDATLIAATVAFHPKGSTEQHEFELRPPDTIKPQRSEDTARILSWFATSSFKLARAAALVLLALLSLITIDADAATAATPQDTENESFSNGTEDRQQFTTTLNQHAWAT